MCYNFVADGFHAKKLLMYYQQKQIENQTFPYNAVSLTQNFTYKRSPPPIIFA